MNQGFVVQEKLCRRCRKLKPMSEFYRHRGKLDGRQTYCKACHNQVSVRNKQKLAAQKEKTCRTCGETKLIAHFQRSGTRRRAHCIECMRHKRTTAAAKESNKNRKTCATCGRSKALSSFYFDATTADFRSADCKTCYDERRLAEQRPLAVAQLAERLAPRERVVAPAASGCACCTRKGVIVTNGRLLCMACHWDVMEMPVKGCVR